MSKIRLDADHTLVNGESLTFNAPCACNNVDGIIVYYPDESGAETSKAFCFTDSHGNNLTGLGNLFASGAYVKVVLDIVNNRAFVQNADTNKYLEDKIANITPAAIGAMKIYTSLSELGLSEGTATMGDIVTKMDNSSMLLAPYVTAGSEAGLVPTSYGLLKVTKRNDSYATLTYESFNPYGAMVWEGYYNGGTDKKWSGWYKIATTDYALPRDGSAAMTGDLWLRDGLGRTTAWQGGVGLDAQLPNGKISRLQALVYEDRAEANLAFFDGNVWSAKEILHTGNMASLGCTRIQRGSYTGTGTYGSDNPVVIECAFEPQLVIVSTNGIRMANILVCVKGVTNVENIGNGSSPTYTIFNGTTLEIYDKDSYDDQMNRSGTPYYWVALG